MSRHTTGFWVSGSKYGPRQLVSARRCFEVFATCDESVRPAHEHYLSAFTYGPDFKDFVRDTGSTARFPGACWAYWIWIDIDRGADIDSALAAARAMCLHLEDHWGVRTADILVFLSGNKGFHIGVPTALWNPEPSPLFNQVAHRFALALARGAGGNGIVIDETVYSKVQLFRAPNSRHPTTGLRKRVLTVEELLGIGIERIVELAREPLSFEIPAPTGRNERLAAAWAAGAANIAAEAEAMRTRTVDAAGLRLNALTLDFIREGADEGGEGKAAEAGRHRRLYAAAINLGEFGCPASLAHALLAPTALDCGITPSEVRRTIDNALRNAGKEARGV